MGARVVNVHMYVCVVLFSAQLSLNRNVNVDGLKIHLLDTGTAYEHCLSMILTNVL